MTGMSNDAGGGVSKFGGVLRVVLTAKGVPAVLATFGICIAAVTIWAPPETAYVAYGVFIILGLAVLWRADRFK